MKVYIGDLNRNQRAYFGKKKLFGNININININYNYIFIYLNLIIFICIFPIDASWYMASQVISIPRIPVGFLAIISSIVFSFTYCVLNYRRFRFYLLLMILFLFFSGIASFYSQYSDWEWIVMFFRYISMFSCGYLLSASGVLQKGIGRWSLFLSTLLCIVFSLSYLRGGWIADEQFNYLRTASSLMATATFALFSVRSRILMAFIYAGVLASLILINSRTFLYLWLLFPAFVLIARQIRPGAVRLKRICYWAFAIFVMFSVIYAIIRWVLPELANFGNGRLLPNIGFLEFPGGISSIESTDNSINSRMNFSRFGWDQIIDSPVLGYYNGFLVYGGPGSYIHNILSYWHQFGLIPFIIILYFIFLAFRHQFSLGNSSNFIAAKVFLIATVVASLAARAYVSTELFFALGFALGFSVPRTVWRRFECLHREGAYSPASLS